jgi:hypothetical protein
VNASERVVAAVSVTTHERTARDIAARRCGTGPTLPAEVWLDDRGRICRMSCVWPRKARRWWWKRFGPPHWTFTELWDFGVPAEIPKP